jgi:hypothetical protein
MTAMINTFSDHRLLFMARNIVKPAKSAGVTTMGQMIEFSSRK